MNDRFETQYQGGRDSETWQVVHDNSALLFTGFAADRAGGGRGVQRRIVDVCGSRCIPSG